VGPKPAGGNLDWDTGPSNLVSNRAEAPGRGQPGPSNGAGHLLGNRSEATVAGATVLGHVAGATVAGDGAGVAASNL